jgi:hypothetical protein
MKPAEPFLTIPQFASPVEPESHRAATGGRADSLVVRIIAAGVVWAAAASIVCYFVDTVLAL